MASLHSYRYPYPYRTKRWSPREKDFIYPPEGCGYGVDCKMCPLFTCGKCKKKRPWCIGASGPHPSWCDICWAAYHAQHKACGTCTRSDRQVEMAAHVARHRKDLADLERLRETRRLKRSGQIG